MYSKLPNLVLGFHGCNRETYNDVIKNGGQLKISTNDYDWLGNGIYFWENNLKRAQQWADERFHSEGAVIGAILDLGNCLNLLESNSIEALRRGYDILKYKCELLGQELPQNKYPKNNNLDRTLRNLDCAVIQEIHQFNKINNLPKYDSVRGLFFEGKEAFPGSDFKEQTHIQIAISNLNCIKGYFAPLNINKNFNLP